MRWLFVRHGVAGGSVELCAAACPTPPNLAKKQTQCVPKTGTKSGTQNWNHNSYPRPLLFENKLCVRKVPKQVPKMGTIFGSQSKNPLQPNARPRETQPIPKQVPKMGTILVHKTRTHYNPMRSRVIRKRPKTCSQTGDHFWYPKPEFITNQCAAELPRARRKRRQNKFPTWWPFCVQNMGSHCNTMRS
jgi:hypothetical protein